MKVPISLPDVRADNPLFFVTFMQIPDAFIISRKNLILKTSLKNVIDTSSVAL